MKQCQNCGFWVHSPYKTPCPGGKIKPPDFLPEKNNYRKQQKKENKMTNQLQKSLSFALIIFSISTLIAALSLLVFVAYQ